MPAKTRRMKAARSGGAVRLQRQPACACSRHIVALFSTLLWLAVPALYVLGEKTGYHVALSFATNLVVACLSVLGCLLRPYCGDLVSEEDSDEEANDPAAIGNGSHSAAKEKQQAVKGPPPNEAELWPSDFDHLKLLWFWIAIIACGVGSNVLFAMGGFSVLQLSHAPQKKGCAVEQLQGLEQDFRKFHCLDGSVDLVHHRSVMKKQEGFQSAMAVYRIAPVYSDSSRTKGTDPVAWAVSKDMEMPRSPLCAGNGLCGLFVQAGGLRQSCASSFSAGESGSLFCPTVEEQDLFRQISADLAKDLGAASRELPLVTLTDPENPFGQNYLLYLAAALYGLTLVTLVGFQLELLLEPCRTVGGATATGGIVDSYDPVSQEPVKE